jgi:hypothetical protein
MPYNAPAKQILHRSSGIRAFSTVEKILLYLLRSKTIRIRHKKSLKSRILGNAFENYVRSRLNASGCPDCRAKKSIIRLEKNSKNHRGSDLKCTRCNSEIQVKHVQAGILGDKTFGLGSAKEQRKIIKRVGKKKLFVAVGNWYLFKTLSYTDIKITYAENRFDASHGPKAKFKIKIKHHASVIDDSARFTRTKNGIKERRAPGSDCWKKDKNSLTSRAPLV